jgi:predicted nucleotidyltransferase
MQHLKHKAQEIAQFYTQNPKVDSLLLAGSISRNWQDEHSDIELHILWSEPPTDEDRLAPIKKATGSILSFHPYEKKEWSEAYLTHNGVKLEISSFLTSSVERFVDDVVVKYESDYDKQCIAASFYHGESLYGEEKINELKHHLLQYPVELSKVMILENLHLGNRWNNRQALLERQDWLMLYSVICEVQTKLFGILFGLNKMYVHHPSFKWMKQSIRLMSIKPANLYERMADILTGKPESSIKELTVLIMETAALVEERFPELISSELKNRLEYLK